MERPNAWKKIKNKDAVLQFSEEYKTFLSEGKTERECTELGCAALAKAGFKELKTCIRSGEPLKAGDKVYRNWMNKSIVAYIIGTEPMTAGMNILGAHIDSPRIDIKQNPLYEDGELAYLDTHYYGGIKKYQWVAIPLAIHGVVVKKNGEKIVLNIGENQEDPVFCISDLLPHLAQEQMTQTGAKLIEGENLNLIIGGEPIDETEEDGNKKKELVKEKIIAILKEKYAIEEEDFLSAELEIVPAGAARDMGLDRSMILGYGHDDRSCAYPSLRALMDYRGVPKYTLCAVLTDKEEIGSVGATGMASNYFENITAEVLALTGEQGEIALRRTLTNSRMLSSDVSAGFDPDFASAFEKKNAAYLGHGICFNKYTGSRGKSGSNDANAEYIAQIRRIMDEGEVSFQTAELGRVDLGGGGTIAYLCAKYGMNVIDSGIPVLSMHAPWEIISKIDLYEAYRCYCAFLNGAQPCDD